jgi:hypothetical protein
LLALALSGGARADIPDPGPDCEVHAELAERVMRHRQQTNDLEGTWRLAGLIRNPAMSRIAQGFVQEAYRRPRQTTEERREQAVTEFAAEAREACRADAKSPA